MANHIIDNGEKSPAVYVSKKWKHFYQTFCTNRNNTEDTNIPLFDKYTNIYTLCAVIGYKEGKRTPLETKESVFTLEQLDNEEEWPLLVSIGWLSSNRDMSIFADSKKILDICSEYAETGITKLLSLYPFNEIYKNGKVTISHIDNTYFNEIYKAVILLKKSYTDEII